MYKKEKAHVGVNDCCEGLFGVDIGRSSLEAADGFFSIFKPAMSNKMPT